MRTPIEPLVFLSLVIACQRSAPSPPPVTAAPARASPPLIVKLRAVEQRMHDRFGAARRLEEAIALGDLDRAHEEARTIGTLDEPDVLPQWQPYFAGVATAAAGVADAPDLETAATQAGLVGLRCAQCHAAAESKIELPRELRPADDPKRGPTMAAHHWAATQMWTGLIGRADARWLAGAEALTTVPLTMVAQAVTPTSLQDVDDVSRIRNIARRALVEPTLDGRAALFGTLLGRCAHCHQALRDR